MTEEEIIADIIFVLLLIVSSVCLIYYLLKDREETELIKYYTIDHSSYGYYKITLWAAEVYTYRNKCKKKPIKIEQTETLYKHNIEEVEKRYNKNGIYPAYRTGEVEKCLLKTYY